MLILGVALGLIAGLAVGGSLENLLSVRLRWIGLLFLAAIVRFGTEYALLNNVAIAQDLRLPLFAGSYALLLAALYRNRQQPGMAMAFVGILSNAIVIVANGGYMPIWEPSLAAVGMTAADVASPLHVIVPAQIDAAFLIHLDFLGDIIPIPVPFLTNIASLGDIFLSVGLGFFLFASTVRNAADRAAGAAGVIPSPERLALAVGISPAELSAIGTFPAETGLSPNLAEAAALERPVILGGTPAGLSSPGISSVTIETAAQRAQRRARVPDVLERARHHPYVRLALNGSFSALWVGQVISLSGDRLHQIALAFLVLEATNSLVAVGLVFLVATLPNLLLGPVAGTFVDRWDQKEVMIVSDLLRASLVLLVPIAAITNLALVYPMVFLITSISIFFRPARTAVIPRIVAEDELVAANSATWIAETFADVIAWPLAGVFVAFLGRALPLAFWLDAATYVASAILIGTMIVPPVKRRIHVPTDASASMVGTLVSAAPFGATEVEGLAASERLAPGDSAANAKIDGLAASESLAPSDAPAPLTSEHAAAAEQLAAAESMTATQWLAAASQDAMTEADTGTDSRPEADAAPIGTRAAIRAAFAQFKEEFLAGYHFLRGDAVLLANTLQATVGQFTNGVLLALAVAYAADVINRGSVGATAAYAFLEAAIGVGNLIGGFAIGLVGARLARGRMVIAGYAIWGLCTIGLAFAGNLGLALGLMFGSGVANMLYVIPSQTLFQERTPPELIGRVVGFRSSLVFGSMTLATGIAGLMAQQFGITPVIGLFGVVTLVAGLAGLLVPAVRDA